MAPRDEFHRHLDEVWPLWRQHEGEMLYHLRWASFSAGHHLGANGAPAAALRKTAGRPVNALRAMTSGKQRRFKEPRHGR